MSYKPPLCGVRVFLSGALHGENDNNILEFLEIFSKKLFSEGGSIIHGSHPSFVPPLAKAAQDYIASGAEIGSLVLARAKKFSETKEQRQEIDEQRNYALVQIVQSYIETEALIPMRDWMAERADVIVCIGGKWWDKNKSNAGVPAELESMLDRGKPAFIVAGFGGAIEGYTKEHYEIFRRLRNGLSEEENEKISFSTSVEDITNSIISQLKRLPLVRRNFSRGRNFRILALDGGGLRGVFTAAVLSKWDDMISSGGGNRIVSHFDLVAGTSTGAILAIGLALGMKPAEILKFYQTNGPHIFPADRGLRHWLRSKHESATLKDVLSSVFGDKKLSESSCCRLVLPTVRAQHGKAEAIVTSHTPDRTAFRDIRAVDAALASSAAPTYFDEAMWEGPITIEPFLDGGVWANNPILPALAEATRHLNIPLDRIDVLSIGTLTYEQDFTASLKKGKLGWAPHSADLFIAAQEYGAGIIAESFLGPARHLRVNQQLNKKIELDDLKAIDDMIKRGNAVGKDSFIEVRSRFLDGLFAEQWQRY